MRRGKGKRSSLCPPHGLGFLRFKPHKDFLMLFSITDSAHSVGSRIWRFERFWGKCYKCYTGRACHILCNILIFDKENQGLSGALPNGSRVTFYFPLTDSKSASNVAYFTRFLAENSPLNFSCRALLLGSGSIPIQPVISESLLRRTIFLK